MLSAAKVTEIYCMTDDFAGNLCCTGKNIWLGIKYCNMFKLYVSVEKLRKECNLLEMSIG